MVPLSSPGTIEARTTYFNEGENKNLIFFVPPLVSPTVKTFRRPFPYPRSPSPFPRSLSGHSAGPLHETTNPRDNGIAATLTHRKQQNVRACGSQELEPVEGDSGDYTLEGWYVGGVCVCVCVCVCVLTLCGSVGVWKGGKAVVRRVLWYWGEKDLLPWKEEKYIYEYVLSLLNAIGDAIVRGRFINDHADFATLVLILITATSPP